MRSHDCLIMESDLFIMIGEEYKGFYSILMGDYLRGEERKNTTDQYACVS